MGFARCEHRSNFVEVLQTALPPLLGPLIAFVNDPIGEFPGHRDHRDAVLLFDFVGHFPQFFAAHVDAGETKQAFTVVQHRLNHLQAVVGLRLGDPDQTTAAAIDGGHVGFDLAVRAE